MRRLTLVVALASCSVPQDVQGIAGTYVMHQKWAADTLHLRADGRYVRSYHADGAAAATDSGRWFLSKSRKLVALRDYPKRWEFVHDLMGDTTHGRVLTQPSTIALTVERSRLGKFRLGWHSEWGWWYERISRD